MKAKTVGIADLLKAFEGYVTSADLLASRLLANISVAITKKRLDLKMNQTEFAKLLGVSQGMVSKWESENYNYTVEGLANICDKLEMDLEITIEPKVAQDSCSRQNSWKTTVAPMEGVRKVKEHHKLKLVS